METPRMTAAEARSQQVFTAIMWSLSYPGRPHALPERGLAAYSAIAATLVDLETSYYTNDDALAPLLAHTGGIARPSDQALYQFYPRLASSMLVELGNAPVGSYTYPDESATIIIGCSFGTGNQLELHGPGIASTNSLLVDGIPPAFWPLRARACRFPLGWDVLLVGEGTVAGLPRTTQIEVH